MLSSMDDKILCLMIKMYVPSSSMAILLTASHMHALFTQQLQSSWPLSTAQQRDGWKSGYEGPVASSAPAELPDDSSHPPRLLNIDLQQ